MAWSGKTTQNDNEKANTINQCFGSFFLPKQLFDMFENQEKIFKGMLTSPALIFRFCSLVVMTQPFAQRLKLLQSF